MNKLIFKNLYLFSTSEKLAKHISFSDGINIIASSQVNGNDRGKSVIMKSLYHTLGADAHFDDMWDDKTKTYILHFAIDDVEYYIYRCNRLFKFFNSEKTLLFSTIDRNELAANLKYYFKFAVELPDRTNNKLEITPVAYNYLLSFVDQDCYNGTNFSSFLNLAQYSNYKENVLYYHFGAFDDHYFEIEKILESLKVKQNDLKQHLTLTDSLFTKTVAEIHGNTYTANIDLLRIEVEKTQEEYTAIVDQLSTLKNKLIQLHNQKYELESTLHELKNALKDNEKEITQLNNHICPYCKSAINDTLDMRAEKYSTADDIIFMNNDIQQTLLDITHNITVTEKRYKDVLEILKAYEQKIKLNSTQIDDVLKHHGYMQIRDHLLSEMGELKVELVAIEQQIAAATLELSKYETKKKQINADYYKLLSSAKAAFGLSEINNTRFENIKFNFKAGGSNKPIATVIWYITLTKLKNKYNPTAIKFPLVFDSPNNAEMDDEKRKELLAHLIKNSTNNNQMIISAIGFQPEQFISSVEMSVTLLNNEKYQLLCTTDFEANKKLLFDLNRQQTIEE